MRAPSGRLADRYELVRELGRDDTGTVWLADDQLVRRQVVVRELRPPHRLSQDEREAYSRRALHEARTAARISHPGAVILDDVLADAGGAVYLIMEFAGGPTMAQLIAQHGRLPAPDVAGYGLQLLSVLEAAHRLGIVHGDVEPANIIIMPGGRVKLIDFGITHTPGGTRLTGTGVIGTQAYLAPEMFGSAPVTPAADLWSLGAALYAAAEGHGPFDRDSADATRRAILLAEPPAPSCPPALASAITSMLQRDPARRATAGQARACLLQAAGVPAQPPGPAAIPHVAAHPLPQPLPQRFQPGLLPPSRIRRAHVITVLAAAALLAAAAIAVPVLLIKPIDPAALGSPRPEPSHHHPAPGHAGLITPAADRHPVAALTSGANTGDDNSVAFSPDGKLLAAGNGDGGTYLWDVAARTATTLTDPGGSGVNGVAFSPDGKTLAAADADGKIYLWDVATHHLTATLTSPVCGGGDLGPDSVAFSPDGQTLADGAEGAACLWHVATGQVAVTLTGVPQGTSVTAVAFSPNGKTLAGGDSTDASTYMWNVATGQLTATLTDPGGQGVTAVAFSPDGQRLAAGDAIDRTYLWDIAARSVTATLADGALPGRGGVDAVAFSPDGKTLATGDGNDTIYLWDVATGQWIASLADPSGSGLAGVFSLAFSPDGQTLAAGDTDGTAYLWHAG